MFADLLGSRLLMGPDPVQFILVFFTYSFLGYVLECIVLTIEKRQLVINRGFTSHLPFCIIYGFGAILGFALLSPFRGNMLLLFFAGAAVATTFEYLVARLQLRLFGHFWWDYSQKPFNYKGILCLESTIGWGLVAILVINVLHRAVLGFVYMIPRQVQAPLAVLLLTGYCVDFLFCARAAYQRKKNRDEEVSAVYYDDNYQG